MVQHLLFLTRPVRKEISNPTTREREDTIALNSLPLKAKNHSQDIMWASWDYSPSYIWMPGSPMNPGPTPHTSERHAVTHVSRNLNYRKEKKIIQEGVPFGNTNTHTPPLHQTKTPTNKQGTSKQNNNYQQDLHITTRNAWDFIFFKSNTDIPNS